jgi:hypothetical protein
MPIALAQKTAFVQKQQHMRNFLLGRIRLTNVGLTEFGLLDEFICLGKLGSIPILGIE